MNEIKDIDELLTKYFEGETSLLEEETLRNYFEHNNVDEQHKVYAPMFGYFSGKRNNKQETEQDEVRIIPPPKTKKIYLYMLGVAVACIAILLITSIPSFFAPKINDNETVAYIDGQKISNKEIINSQALITIENVADMDNEAISSQIDILDSFIE